MSQKVQVSIQQPQTYPVISGDGNWDQTGGFLRYLDPESNDTKTIVTFGHNQAKILRYGANPSQLYFENQKERTGYLYAKGYRLAVQLFTKKIVYDFSSSYGKLTIVYMIEGIEQVCELTFKKGED